jgi:hypothetical protein
MALRSNQYLTEMSTMNNFVCKGGRCVGLTTLYHLYVPIVLKFGNLRLLEPSESVQACNGITLSFTIWKSQSYLILLALLHIKSSLKILHSLIKNRNVLILSSVYQTYNVSDCPYWFFIYLERRSQ